MHDPPLPFLSTTTKITIHDIIIRVDSDGSFHSSSPFKSQEKKYRRARLLHSEALNIIALLRDELIDHDKLECDAIHRQVADASYAGGSWYLETSERLWDFALRTFCKVSHTNIMASVHPARSQVTIPPSRPPQLASTTQKARSPSQASVTHWMPVVLLPVYYTPCTPVQTWWTPNVSSIVP
ncbi:uncharacterized protein LAESUDRAFT_728085 [Laetiporus sulphureus 93-53]|uniref:Uncharacterized protein n=1 Tax=Laetiporus sulphureus 93-53 TaxID=1314785 RepID=A0A165D7J6_9APHY|nr:uncharacterized protein LAESUDRAFT_728085 [Laetiporus sulphureus 93-53]KZT04280.1 hypothetical protein LAESUDRAFT_728085 [Laetiporus sulphureus 93-53]